MNQQQLIDQIHSEFDTAQDRLLNEANEILSKNCASVVDISERLRAIGFTNTPVAKTGNELKSKIVKSTQEAELITHYKQTYPFLKFLTEDELNRICTKYKLVYAPIGRYIKDVPEKNLRDIETAQSLKQDDSIPNLVIFKYKGEVDGLTDSEKAILKDGIVINENAFEAFSNSKTIGQFFNKTVKCRYDTLDWSIEKVDKSGLFIAAPDSHFETTGLVKKGLGFFSILKVEVKDPIVFRYVNGGVQVITKWGLEANDPALVVPVLN